MRALVEALAEKEGIDVERVTAEAHIAEAEREGADADQETLDTEGGDAEPDPDERD